MSQHLHIVCFDAPSPPDYGGAIDVFHRIKALSRIGKKITLHYFSYKKERNIEGLEKDCSAIFIYKRKVGLRGLSLTKPYIVSSRINKALINNLNRDDDPIIIEGIHCSGIIPALKNNNRKIIIRAQNDEEKYYRHLAKNESRPFHKMYYNIETRLLSRYQKILPQHCNYVCLSETDAASFREILPLNNVYFIPSFIPWESIKSLEGKGNYCLYHGNLSVSENSQAVAWLINYVFSSITIPLVIAGKNPPEYLYDIISRSPNVSIVGNPTNEELLSLIRNAHINVLPSFNNTGVKLKLLHALFEGRYCITNKEGIRGSGISESVFVSETSQEFIQTIKELYQRSFTSSEIKQRMQICETYDNNKNAERLNELL